MRVRSFLFSCFTVLFLSVSAFATISESTTPSSGIRKSFLIPVPFLKHQNEISLVAVEIWKPLQVKADILYFHGHADQARNHERLFHDLAQAGFRVIAFDLPQHGRSRLGALDLFSFEDLLKVAAFVERQTFESGRNLFLMGWSFGGFLTLKGVGDSSFVQSLTRRPAGMIALAPAVQGKMLVGQDGWVRRSTLTQNEDLVLAEPSPKTIFSTPLFAARYLWEAFKLRQTKPDFIIPHLILFPDQKWDEYVDVQASKDWFLSTSNVNRRLIVCREAWHALDWEPEPLYQEIKQSIFQFLDPREKSDLERKFCSPEVL